MSSDDDPAPGPVSVQPAAARAAADGHQQQHQPQQQFNSQSHPQHQQSQQQQQQQQQHQSQQPHHPQHHQQHQAQTGSHQLPAKTTDGPASASATAAPPAQHNAVGSMGAPPSAVSAAERQRQMSDPERNAEGGGETGGGPTRSNSFWQSSSSLSLDTQSSDSTNGTGNGQPPNRRPRWSKARSTSTESSLSLSGITTLGSMYNQDGFPNYPQSSDDDRDITQIAMDDAAIAKQLALTDETVRAINGTPSVVSAQGLGMPNPPTSGNTYELPRSMAAFVRRPGEVGGAAGRGNMTGRSFVSSGSSTSSEESEHLASVQWVNSVSTPSGSYPSSYYPFYGNQQNRPTTSSPKMPPPATTSRKVASPRLRNGVALPSLSAQGTPTQGFVAPGSAPLSANTAHGGTPIAGVSTEGSPDNDDDDQTVGGLREGSPSSSSASGLDLLSHAAAQHHHHERRYSTQTKRKAGAEAVAQWRESGIPSGPMRRGEAAHYDSPGYESTPSADGQQRDDQGMSEPPKKRRKSEMQLEQPDPRLRQSGGSGAGGAHGGGSEEGEGDSEYESASGASDSEYHGRRTKPKVKNRSKNRVRSTLAIPPPPTSSSSTKPASSGSKKGAKGSTPTKARRMSENSEKPNMAGGGVQCEYVNPLPPYQRCEDRFTRKYDIPRHMARHARREGDLVTEGKLALENAKLYKAIMDKPKIRCASCGETFTRQDALKRHQAKQHHN